MIPEKPKNAHDGAAAEQILAVARSYLANADRLIYSYGSRTFLSGYALYDRAYGGRGNIDCSTFVILVLAGIPYEASPYALGTVEGMKPGPFFWVQTDLEDFSGLPRAYVDIAERICIERAKEIFSSRYANVQAHSGSQANFCVYLALCQPGDTVLGMDLSMGVHLTHGSKASFSGKFYNSVFYGVSPETGRIDYDQVRALAEEWAPRGNHVGPTGKSRGPPGEITWAPRGNHVGPTGKSRGPHGEITSAPRGNHVGLEGKS